MKLLALLRSLFDRTGIEKDTDEELRAHVLDRREDLERSGLTREEAARRARIEFGGHEKFREECREERGGFWLETVWSDIRFGARMLRNSPGFTAVAIFTLALGIGANTAIFSVVDAVLLRPLPYAEPDRIVTVAESNRPYDLPSRNEVSAGNFFDWRLRNHVFEQIGAVHIPGYSITGTDRPERVQGAAISAGMLHLLGLRPALGREFETADDRDGAPPVVMLA